MRGPHAKKPRPAHKLKTPASPTGAGEPPARSAAKSAATHNLIAPLEQIGSQITGALGRPCVHPVGLQTQRAQGASCSRSHCRLPSATTEAKLLRTLLLASCASKRRLGPHTPCTRHHCKCMHPCMHQCRRRLGEAKTGHAAAMQSSDHVDHAHFDAAAHPIESHANTHAQQHLFGQCKGSCQDLAGDLKTPKTST